MPKNATTRRTFLKAAGAALVGAVFSPNASSYARIAGANERVRVGLVGSSDRARSALIPAFYKHASELNFDVVAVSDIWSVRRAEATEYFQKRFNKTVALALNNDELYDLKDVNAVIIATAHFHHALHGGEAAGAGRHAYGKNAKANTMED